MQGFFQSAESDEKEEAFGRLFPITLARSDIYLLISCLVRTLEL